MHDPALRTWIAIRKHALRSAKRAVQIRLINARYRSVMFRLEAARLRFLITVLKTPDYLSAVLVGLVRR